MLPVLQGVWVASLVPQLVCLPIASTLRSGLRAKNTFAAPKHQMAPIDPYHGISEGHSPLSKIHRTRGNLFLLFCRRVVDVRAEMAAWNTSACVALPATAPGMKSNQARASAPPTISLVRNSSRELALTAMYLF